MALCWVKAGACGQETSIEARKVDMTHVAFEITTTCEHIQALAEALGRTRERATRPAMSRLLSAS